MFESFLVLLVLGGIFGAMYFAYRFTTKMNYKLSEGNIGKVVATFPISYKTAGYIVRIDKKYFFCCENCGIVEIDYSDNLDKLSDNSSFQSILSKQFEKIKTQGINKVSKENQ